MYNSSKERNEIEKLFSCFFIENVTGKEWNGFIRSFPFFHAMDAGKQHRTKICSYARILCGGLPSVFDIN